MKAHTFETYRNNGGGSRVTTLYVLDSARGFATSRLLSISFFI
jgi:hypothetical protein